MIFLFPKWDMLVPWRAIHLPKIILVVGFKYCYFTPAGSLGPDDPFDVCIFEMRAQTTK